MSKKRFIIFGFANTLVTNIILQILLFFIQISLATLISQLISMIIGLNWSGIYFLSLNGIKKNIAAILLIPFLALFSYLIQKRKVFV